MAHSWWMVRAEGGELFAPFEKKQIVALGWHKVEDLATAKDREAVRARYDQAYPDASAGRAPGDVAMLHKIRSVIAVGDRVVTYDPNEREYLIGEVMSDYFYDPALLEQYPHARRVKWLGRVSRDVLKAQSRNSLGSTLTLFSIDGDVGADLQAGMNKSPDQKAESDEEEQQEFAQVKETNAANAFEFVKDRILKLDDRQMEHLVASILRAMGYSARVTPVGPDRGVDVIASPDGLGFETPRIKAEVKHRTKTAIGGADVRSFIGGLREGDRGLYVSTGGYSKDARYEADRANHPVTLIGLDELAQLVLLHYEAFDVDGKILLPLVKIYMPA